MPPNAILLKLSKAAKASPVPAYIHPVDGSRAKQLMLRLVNPFAGCHDCPPFSEYHTPPEAAPTIMRFGLLGSINIALVLPPWLVGPRLTH